MSVTPKISFVSLENCMEAEGVVVAVDVCRAFTTAAYGLAAGAERILLVGTVEEALALKEQTTNALVMGEYYGKPVPQFDLWNSPGQLAQLDLRGRTLIQRTSAGTQGIVRSVRAEHLLAASFAVAGATLRAIQRRAPSHVTFVLTGLRTDKQIHGLEDVACAEYLTALLRGQQVAVEDYLTWVDQLSQNQAEDLEDPLHRQFQADVALCALPDRFDFALRVVRSGGLWIMERE